MCDGTMIHDRTCALLLVCLRKQCAVLVTSVDDEAISHERLPFLKLAI